MAQTKSRELANNIGKNNSQVLPESLEVSPFAMCSKICREAQQHNRKFFRSPLAGPNLTGDNQDSCSCLACVRDVALPDPRPSNETNTTVNSDPDRLKIISAVTVRDDNDSSFSNCGKWEHDLTRAQIMNHQEDQGKFNGEESKTVSIVGNSETEMEEVTGKSSTRVLDPHFGLGNSTSLEGMDNDLSKPTVSARSSSRTVLPEYQEVATMSDVRIR